MIKNIILFAAALVMSASIASAQTAPVQAGSTPYYVSIMGGTEVSPGGGFDRQSVGKFSVGSYVNSISKDLRGEFSYERLIGQSHGLLGTKSGNMFLATALYDLNAEKYTGLIFSAGPTVGYLALDGSRAVNGTKEDGFVYGGILETSFRLTPNVALVGSYQYITSTEAETIKKDSTSTAWTNQSVLAGLRYRF